MKMKAQRLAGRWVTWVLSLALVVASQIPALAGQAPGATVQGRVEDASGGVLPGVTVTVTDRQTGRARSGVSDARGDYQVAGLDAGDYEVRAVLPGFRAEPATISVGEGGTGTLDLVLSIAPIAETVTVSRTDHDLTAVPSSVAVVQRDTIEVGQRQSSLDEALRGIPGVFIQNRHSYGLSGGIGLSIRAPEPRFGLRGIAMVQDGIPITTADGTTEPGNVDMGSVGRIEVVRGPSSVLYGNSAGGVVNLTTEFNPSRRLTLLPNIQFGSYGYKRQQLRTEGRAGDTDFLVNLSHFETDGFREQSRTEITQANVVVRNYLSPATEVRGVFNFYDSPFAESASFLNETDARNDPRMARQIAIDQDWREVTTQGQGGVSLERRFEGGQLLRATGWGMWRDLEVVGVGQIIDLGRTGGGFRTEALGATELGTLPVQWTTGLDLSSQSDDRQEFALVTPSGTSERGGLQIDQQEKVLSLGPFAHALLEVHPRWRVSAGVRYDHYDFNADDRKLDDGDQSGNRTMSAVSPSVGVTFLATSGINVYSTFATAYETPTTVELSNQPSGAGGFNQDLEPEDLKSFEVGVRGLIQPSRLRYELAVYTSNLTKVLIPVQAPNEVIYFTNAGESSRNGLELLLEWVPDPSLSARFAYTYQDFAFEEFVLDGNDFGGNKEPGAAPHQVFAGVTHRAPFGLTSIAQLRWTDEYAVNNANTAFNWASTVVDLRFALDRKWQDASIRPFLGIDNVFNERYNAATITNAFGGRYYHPAPDREVYGGVTVEFGVR